MTDVLDAPSKMIVRGTTQEVKPGDTLHKAVKGFGEDFKLVRLEDGVLIVRKYNKWGWGAEQRRTLDYFGLCFEGAAPERVKVDLDYVGREMIAGVRFVSYKVTRAGQDRGLVYVSMGGMGAYRYGGRAAQGGEPAFSGSRNEFFAWMRGQDHG